MATVANSFLDYVNNVTEKQPLSRAESYENIISRNKYSMNALMGSDMTEHMQTSHSFRANIYGKKVDQGRWHGGAGFTTQSEGTNTVFKLTSGMAYHYNYIRYDDEEVDSQDGPGVGQAGGGGVWADTMKAKLQNAHQSNADSFEDAIWSPANQALMVDSPERPMSIPYLVSEEGYLALQEDGSNVTSVYNATAANLPTFDNARYTYANLGGNDQGGEDLFGSLDEAWLQAGFEPIPEHPEYGKGCKLNHIVFCSHWGIKVILGALREGQTVWGEREVTPFGVRVGTMLFKPITALDTAALYDDGSGGLANEVDADKNGPRFYGINMDKTKLIFQNGHFQRMEKPVDMTAAGEPYSHHQNIKTKCQLWCSDRRSNFIVSPDAGAVA